jgi:hypothetical protein
LPSNSNLISLSSVLHTSHRPKVPESVLSVCLVADKTVVENAIFVSLEYIRELNIAETGITKQGLTYNIKIPFSSEGEHKVSLSSLRNIQNWNPARISEIFIENGFIRIVMLDETKPLSCTEIDIIRMSKKRRC